MRVVQNEQMTIGEVDISKMNFDPKSRDDIPKILKGLQFVYTNLPLRTAIFQLLDTQVAPKVSKANGRPGMPLWTILVCGVIRLDLNCDYDRLHELVNQHNSIREMLGHGAFSDVRYHFQTLKDNVALLTPELLDQINQRIVEGGHVLVKKKAGQALRGRCDSFVVETDVHFPTDISVLFDAMRKVITLSAQWCQRLGKSDWRQHAYNVRHLKRLMRTAQNKKRSKAKSPEQLDKNAALIVAAHQEYLAACQAYLDKALQTLTMIEAQGYADAFEVTKRLEIEGFMQHAVRQIEQTRRRVIEGEVIGHEEKVFSIFEPHTEWISKVRREVAYVIVSPAHKAGEETGRSVDRSLPVHALSVTTACEATGTTCRAFGPHLLPRGRRRHLQALQRMGCKAWVKWSTHVNCCKHRYTQQAKDADRLEPKWYVVGCSPFARGRTDSMTTGVQAGPTPLIVMYAEHGKPDASPETAGQPQGRLLAQRVKECGESQCRPVIGRIRVATSPDAKASRLPRGLSWQESLINCEQEEGR